MMTESDNAHEAMRHAAGALRKAGMDTPELDARLLILDALGLSLEEFMIRPETRLGGGSKIKFHENLNRRLAREPISRILGRREFWGREFRITEHVLDPRPDSETLIEAALETAAGMKPAGRPLRILDLGTGSGCLLVTMLGEIKDAWGIGVDKSPEALICARDNARRLGVTGRAGFVCGNWLDALQGPFDMVLANPPYIRHNDIGKLAPEVAGFDPAAALDGGVEGLDCYREIMSGVYSVLADRSAILFEIGAGQAEEVSKIAGRKGEMAHFRDIAGHIRCLRICFNVN